MNLKKEFYSILEVDENADISEIKKSYKKLSFKWHPDKNINNKEEAENKFKAISEAYQVLSDPKKKKFYDLGLDYSDFNANFEEMFSKKNEFMSNMFAANNFQQSIPVLKIIQKISLADAYFGKKTNIKYSVNCKCDKCNGIGLQNIENLTECKICKGTGKVNDFGVLFPGIVQNIQKTCHECKGYGMVSDNYLKCLYCNGNKIINKKCVINICINPGIPNDFTFLFKEKGNYSKKTRKNGNLEIKIEILEDENIKRIGDNLLIEKNILLVDALCGNVFSINHITNKIFFKTEGTITPNSFKIISNLGMPKFNSKNSYGHLIVKFNIIFPKNLSEKRKEYIKKLLPFEDKNENNYIENNVFDSKTLSTKQNEELFKRLYIEKNDTAEDFEDFYPPVECAQM